MTVEIDQTDLLRAQNNAAQLGPIGTPSIVSSQASTLTGSPTLSMMSTPAFNDSIINRKADPAQGLYQTCLTLRERLRDVPDFEKFLQPPETQDPEMPEDPVTQLWRCFRMGSSLCVLFNATRPVELIQEARLTPKLKTMNDCKAATFHFLKGIKQELDIQGDDAFMIHNLYSDDTNGFVKVTRTVTKILDTLRQRNLLLNRGSSDHTQSAEKKPLDSRARVVQELVDTERKYVQDLENLQDYMRVLENGNNLSKDLIHNLFLNLNQLVDFQRRFLIRVETQNDLPAEQQNWGSLFVQYKSFSVYEPYAANFAAAQNLAVSEREKLMLVPHPVFDQLSAFLIKPVQRVTKYPLLLKDLIKYTDPIAANEQQLSQGLESITRIATQINEAIRKSENLEVVKDLEGRVEDWKGHKLEHFGQLLLHGQFSVIKGDQKGEVEREYYIYLFEKILLCCKEINPIKARNRTMGKNAKVVVPKRRTNLQLKGRIFMQNVTDVISLARNGSYTLQIFWKGDPGVENFMIKHINEENLTHWKKTLQKQVELYKKADTPGKGRGSGNQSTAATQFVWMNTDTGEQGRPSQDDSDAEDEDDLVLYGGTSKFSTNSRNGSTSNLIVRSRSATNENMPQQLPVSNSQSFSRPPAPRFPHPGHTPPLTLNTNPALYLANSPDRNDSYFSPIETPMATSRTSSSSARQYPFPTSYYPDDPNRYTPPNMSRTPSREGSSGSIPPPGPYIPYQAQASTQRMVQRPSLPGMGQPAPPAAQVTAQQNRMRSASSPNIHHVPTASQLSRVSPGGNVPPVPAVPGTYVPYSGGPAVINRSQTNSPTSPQLPMQGTTQRSGSPSIPSTPLEYPYLENGPGTPINGSSKAQVKVKIHYNNDKLAIIVPYGIAYMQLLDRIERKVKICGNGPEISPSSPIRIRYQDEEGDFISMSSDDDVQMAFEVGCEAGPNDSTGTCGAVTLFVQVG
ncbi:hypothetical protein EDC01DRAFT_623953 [Geopyxis carbonaria]|nr:hypothetical protein EDC01DRAFT_623953 [Geopyxis carbonaria]